MEKLRGSSLSSSHLHAPHFFILSVITWALLSAKDVSSGSDERRLINDLLSNYNTLERPVFNESEPLLLKFGLTLQQIIDVDEKNQVLTTNVWLNLDWTDVNMKWNDSEYGNIQDIRIPPNMLWKPDVLMYNSADEAFDTTYPTNVVVSNTGMCTYIPPGIFKSTCKIDITWFPFDDQTCEMKFGSWTYNGFKLDLRLKGEVGDTSSYVTNGEWYLLGVPAKRNEVFYECCPEPYLDVTFRIQIRRRTLYYFFNLIVPCLLISSMAVLGFTLPPDSGEKLSLGVTILLSLTVFLNTVSATMPVTSDNPLLGTYFNAIMMMVASSVVSTIIILNLHHRDVDTHGMPEWIRLIFLQWLPWILCMSRPGEPINLKTIKMQNKMKKLNLNETGSRSLLANVLDMEQANTSKSLPRNPSIGLDNLSPYDHGRESTPISVYPDLHQHPSHQSSSVLCTHHRNVLNAYGNNGSIKTVDNDHDIYEKTEDDVPTTQSNKHVANRTNKVLLKDILEEVRFITDQIRSEDRKSSMKGEWKFAAMVIDRLCLLSFTAFTIIVSITLISSAPHIIVR